MSVYGTTRGVYIVSVYGTTGGGGVICECLRYYPGGGV